MHLCNYIPFCKVAVVVIGDEGNKPPPIDQRQRKFLMQY